MEIKQYLRVLRAHRVLIAAATVLCAAAAGAYSWTRAPVYAADVQLFVSARSEPGLNPSEIYQGGLASQSRAESYARIVSSPPVADAVIRDLDLDESAESIQSAITATVPGQTVLIDITVRHESRALAKDIADTVATEFPRFVETLEGTPTSDESPVEITVTSPAVLPTSPESLATWVFVVGGALVGLLLGIGAAVLRELFDPRVRDDKVVEDIAGAPVLGHIPRDPTARKRPLVVVDRTGSPQAEAYRRLRTNLRVVTIDRGRNSLLVTSAVPGEGKTLVAANLAVSFAQAGHRVALVEADLRRPRLARLFRLDSSRGLTDLLAGEASEEAIHQEGEFPLQVLTSGTPVSNPSELLESERFVSVLDSLSRQSEFVILDSPALLPVSDAAVIARRAAAVLMVTRASSTRAEQFDAATEFLRSVGRPPVGTVLNHVSGRLGDSYGYGSDAVVDAPAAAVPASER